MSKEKMLSISLNRNFIKKFVYEKYRNNLSWFAEEIGVDRSYLALALNDEDNTKRYSSIIVSILAFCKIKKLDYTKFIFFNPICSKKTLNRKE